MNCKQAEKDLLRSFDGRLGAEKARALRAHLEGCARCRKMEREYRFILEGLRPAGIPEPLPYFEQRLRAKIKEKEASPVEAWLKWAHRAVAFSLVAFLIFAAGVVIFQPEESPAVSQAEALYLQNENPFGEAATILEQKKSEDRNLMLIFAASEPTDFSRRYRP